MHRSFLALVAYFAVTGTALPTKRHRASPEEIPRYLEQYPKTTASATVSASASATASDTATFSQTATSSVSDWSAQSTSTGSYSSYYTQSSASNTEATATSTTESTPTPPPQGDEGKNLQTITISREEFEDELAAFENQIEQEDARKLQTDATNNEKYQRTIEYLKEKLREKVRNGRSGQSSADDDDDDDDDNSHPTSTSTSEPNATETDGIALSTSLSKKDNKTETHVRFKNRKDRDGITINVTTDSTGGSNTNTDTNTMDKNETNTPLNDLGVGIGSASVSAATVYEIEKLKQERKAKAAAAALEKAAKESEFENEVHVKDDSPSSSDGRTGSTSPNSRKISRKGSPGDLEDLIKGNDEQLMKSSVLSKSQLEELEELDDVSHIAQNKNGWEGQLAELRSGIAKNLKQDGGDYNLEKAKEQAQQALTIIQSHKGNKVAGQELTRLLVDAQQASGATSAEVAQTLGIMERLKTVGSALKDAAKQTLSLPWEKLDTGKLSDSITNKNPLALMIGAKEFLVGLLS